MAGEIQMHKETSNKHLLNLNNFMRKTIKNFSIERIVRMKEKLE